MHRKCQRTCCNTARNDIITELYSCYAGEIEYHPILLPSQRSSKSWPASMTSWSNSTNHGRRRLSHETLSSDSSSGFFSNVPTPPGSSYSSTSSSSQDATSPYSEAAVSLASPQSSTSNFADLYNNGISSNNFGNNPTDDLELEKIVDDVDNMYR